VRYLERELGTETRETEREGQKERDWSVCVCVCVCVLLHSYSCEVKFVQERGVVRLWQVARFDFLLARNQVLKNEF